MFKPNLLSRTFKVCEVFRRNFTDLPPKNFKIERALLVTKLSRYEFERLRNPKLSETELEKTLRSRGTDYDTLIFLHNLHKNFEHRVAKNFKNAGVEVKLINRTSLEKETLKWADVLIPIGGDGTFLLSANRASPLFAKGKHKTPIVGFNSDPERSEGRLMLRKQYSENVEEAVKRIIKGDFKWMQRSRIRATLLGNNGEIPESVDLHGHAVSRMEQEETRPEYLSPEFALKYRAKMKRILPYLALNEVFIGETMSARVSHLQVVLNHSDVVNKTKCSGLCVSTGTGSTSWHTRLETNNIYSAYNNINRITNQHIEDLKQVLPQLKEMNVNVGEVVEKYNQNLIFPADDPRLCYSVREQICVGVWPSPKEFPSKNFVDNIVVKSRCIDACLVIDGSIAYPFNDGAKVLLENHPEDALLTISLD
ncbi:NAD kinase 2, mitochondrial isoform X2 [Condylostylus longicornis]|uniref:NAD kinase 2, mitochondrial isoform X2 n=1 Tax=Condylostylus longicornis TaxID=2530218 RepID=UPI00244DB1BF|nr:NAD kinase 2, mitochondrial isoform X2 [Condylostylus longicornis]